MDSLTCENIEMTPIQKGIFFEYLANPDEKFYYIQSIYELEGKRNIENLVNTAKIMVAKHPIFRTSFHIDEMGQPIQRIHRTSKIDCRVVEIKEKTDDFLEKILEKDRQDSFNLENPQLIRGTIIEQEKNRFIIVFSYHHILMDGWSAGLARNEFLKIYDILNRNEEYTDIKINDTFQQMCMLQKDIQNTNISFWKETLKQYQPYQIEKLSRTEKNEMSDTHQRNFKLSRNLSQKLQIFAQKYRFTMSTVCLALFFKFLSKTRNREDIVIGLVTSGREVGELVELENIEEAVGCMMKIIPIRSTQINSKSFFDFCKELQSNVLSSIYYSNTNLTSYNKLIEKSNYSDQLFNEIYLYENYPVEEVNFETFSVLKNYAIDKNGFPSVTYFYNDNSNIEIEFQVHSDLYEDLSTYQMLMIECVIEVIQEENMERGLK